MTSEVRRPQFHYSPVRNWMNDPNGLIWHDREYHLFYQHNPQGTAWGNMSWGHAVSPDLVTWTELPVAIPCLPREHVFSGSVVLDKADTAGFGVEGAPAMVAIYTASDPETGHQAQALASSVDRGRTWTRYDGNPVLDIGSSEFRDPKVFWYGRGGHWVMAVVLATERTVQLYRSDDLKSWVHLSDFRSDDVEPGIWECPDLFELRVDGEPDVFRWVLVISVVVPQASDAWTGVLYFVGDFDGVRFTTHEPVADATRLDFGADYYAAVSFADTPDNERVLMGWMNNWTYVADVPSAPFRGSMSIPRLHRLVTVDGRLRITQEPVPSVTERRSASYGVRDVTVAEGVSLLPAEASGEALHIRAVFRADSADRFGLHIRVGERERTVVGYDAASGQLYVDRTTSGEVDFHSSFPSVLYGPLHVDADGIALTVLVDSASVEVFGGKGECVLTNQIFPSPTSSGLAVFAEGGTATITELSVTRLGEATNRERAPAEHRDRDSTLDSSYC